MATFADYLAEVAAGEAPCDWPVLVAASLDLELGEDPADATVQSAAPPVFTERTARRFLDHPCVYTATSADKKRLTIGRSSRCDYRIAHSTVSGSHAELLSHGGGKYELIDKGSRNGTFVEGQQLDPDKPAEVPANVLLHFGMAAFYWVSPDMARTLARVSNP